MRFKEVPKIENIEDKDNYVNIVLNSDSELGKKLSIGYPFKFKTIFGNVGSVRNAIDYVTTPGYPVNLLSKSKLRSEEISKIPKNKVRLTNYYAVVMYILTERVKQDEDLIRELMENDMILTSYYTNKREIAGETVTVIIPKNDNAMLVQMYSDIEQAIKDNGGVLNDEIQEKLIKSYITNPDKRLFDGVPFTVG